MDYQKRHIFPTGSFHLDAVRKVKIWPQSSHLLCNINIKWNRLVADPGFSLSSLVQRDSSEECFLVVRLISLSSCDVESLLLGRKRNLHSTYLLLAKQFLFLHLFESVKTFFCCWGGMNYSYNFLALNQNNDASLLKYLSAFSFNSCSSCPFTASDQVIHRIWVCQMFKSDSELCLTS